MAVYYLLKYTTFLLKQQKEGVKMKWTPLPAAKRREAGMPMSWYYLDD